MSEFILSCNYDWLDSEEQFFGACSGIAEKVEGKILNKVYAVFDKTESEWFFDAPMLIDVEGTFLYVNVSNCCFTAVGIDRFFPSGKPIWFSEDSAPDGWLEDLEWRIFDNVSACFGKRIKKLIPITSGVYRKLFSISVGGLNGVVLELEQGKLYVHDNGDMIFAQYRE